VDFIFLILQSSNIKCKIFVFPKDYKEFMQMKDFFTFVHGIQLNGSGIIDSVRFY